MYYACVHMFALGCVQIKDIRPSWGLSVKLKALQDLWPLGVILVTTDMQCLWLFVNRVDGLGRT